MMIHNAATWRFERRSLGIWGSATSSIGAAAIPDGDQNSIRVVEIHRAAPRRSDGRSARINAIASAVTRGKSAVLVIKPTVPYLSAQRNQKSPEQRERVVEREAARVDNPSSRAARKTHRGRRTQRIPPIRKGYTVSTGKRYRKGAPRKKALSAPVAKKSRASIPVFQSGDQNGIDGKFSFKSFSRKRNIAWSSEKSR
jgi:hypothetical protein